MPYRRLFGLWCLMALITACSDRHAVDGTVYHDAGERVRFVVPEGWTLTSETRGWRFTRADNPDERTTLAVIVSPAETGRNAEKRRETGLAQIRAQGGEVLMDEIHTVNGLSAWESAFRLRNLTVHSVYLFSDDVRVEVKLMGKTALYPQRVDDFKAVVASVEPA